ncbi:dynamin family protein [Diaporthe sp. PMI_573]|nr:dynamin family protein [Diaporthaceae sp. PMI_573]KAH8753352.1 dynamin family protein [Diaporthaceae sp. PMI_573]
MSRSVEPTVMDSLRSKGEAGLLDAIDLLRCQGISHYISLPQLIVCGDQSSGKSSVLEAISGIPFPTRDNMCTRFATEVILRRAPTTGVSVAIVPSQSRTDSERRSLENFHEPLKTLEELPPLIEKAKVAMGLAEMTKAFAEDVLRVEISGPKRPHLTIVDLPGLIHAENKLQTAADVNMVQEMVRSYMANGRSIILAVVSAKNDYPNQIVLKMARDVDRRGHRTLGIITKPDTLPAGSESEGSFANLARNQDIEFRLGWHVLRNRDYDNRDTSLSTRDSIEMDFFSKGIWGEFPRSAVGIDALRIRLSRVLLDQIRNELPDLVEEIQLSIQETRARLERLGTQRRTLDEQRAFLLKFSHSFHLLVKAATDGTYGDSFFGDCKTKEGYSRRLRAVIQNLHLEYAANMRAHGHQRHFVDDQQADSLGNPELGTQPEVVSRSRFLGDISDALKRARGRELPGMYNPLIVGDLFFEQAEPWEKLTERHLRKVLDITRAFLDMAVSHLTDDVTAGAILDDVVGPEMDKRWTELEAKLQELITPYQKGHPITYNHYFTETIQNVRHRRMEEEVSRRLSALYGVQQITSLEELPARKVKITNLVTALSRRNETDMNFYASSEILDCMMAFYKVALKSLVDNVAIYAVELLLVQKLQELLSPSMIMEMDAELLQRIAAESPSAAAQREQLSRKLEVLMTGMETCRRYANQSARSKSLFL